MDFWSVLYTVVLYSALTLVGVLVFYAINRVAQATWATDLYPIICCVPEVIPRCG